jgi:hypothetical protein
VSSEGKRIVQMQMVVTTARQSRWQPLLSQYDLNLIHVPGKDLIVPDALSRRVDHCTNDDEELLITMLPDRFFSHQPTPLHVLTPSLRDRLKITSAIDPTIQNVLGTLTDNTLPPAQRIRQNGQN